MASVSLIRSATQAIFQIFFGLLKTGMPGLLISQLISLLFGLKRQSRYIQKTFSDFFNIKIQEVIEVMKKYKNQPLYSAPAILINSTSYSILNVFIASLYGLVEVGYYSITYRMLGLPIQLVSMNVAKVFFVQASEEKKETGKYTKTLKKTVLFLTLISVPVFVILSIFSPKLFGYIFGRGWEKAGLYVALLSPMFTIRFIVTSITQSLIISNKQKIEIIFQSGFIIEALAAFLISKYSDIPINGFLIIISILFSINYLILLIYIFHLSKKENKV
jgi:O-antigen/teichoic acid export membrane protein